MADSVELEIRIAKSEGRQHRATVVRGLRAGGGVFFDLPADGGLSSGEGDWRDLRRPSAKNDEALFSLLMKQGRALFELVFTGEVYVAFVAAYRGARESGSWFRLQFSFEQAPEAMDLPWEALVFAQENNALALLSQVSIERRLIAAPSMETPRLTTGGKLRALIAGASPPGFDKLDVSGERKWIKAAFAKLVETRLLEHTSLTSLGKELSAGAPFDLVHFIGHGDFEGGEGGLWLEDESGRGIRITGDQLPATLRRPVSFVFLNVCSGGRSSANPFAGLAEALLRSGVRAVVAMRREISDPGAVVLAKNFYKCIAAGETLTRALAKARTSVVHTHTGDWAVPMLYLADDDFALLPRAEIPPIAEPDDTGTPQESKEDEDKKRHGSGKRIVAGALAILLVVFGVWYVFPSSTAPGENQAQDLPSSPVPPPAETLARETQPGTAAAPKDPPSASFPTSSALTLKSSEGGSLSGSEKSSVPQATTTAFRNDKPKSSPKNPVPPLSAEDRRRCPPPPGLSLEMILVRAAGKTFRQGENDGDKDFRPQHNVTLTRDYCLDRYETTRELWHQVYGMPMPSPAEARLPIASVTRDEAREFLELLNTRQSGAFYRLPTESEWEFATRAETKTLFSFGSDPSQLSLYGNCRNPDRPEKPLPVGSLKPNAWGFFDLHGNVWEWVEDNWTSYSPEDITDPIGRNPRARPVRRGGAFDAASDNCWSAARRNLDNSKRQTVGFRIARTPVR